MAAGYVNHLKWNEVAELKADLLNVRHLCSAGLPAGSGLLFGHQIVATKATDLFGPSSRPPIVEMQVFRCVLQARPAASLFRAVSGSAACGLTLGFLRGLVFLGLADLGQFLGKVVRGGGLLLLCRGQPFLP